MPGSPRLETSIPTADPKRLLHPAALLTACALAGVGLALARSPIDLAAVAILGAGLTLASEHRRVRAELPLWGLAAVVFLAHALLSGRPPREAAPDAARIALRMLALLYLLRWAARSFLGRAARWLLELPLPARASLVSLPAESARQALALVPLALREADQQRTALLARGIEPGPGLGGRARYLAAWLLPFLGTMLRLGDSYADALATRGYRAGARRRSAIRAAWGWPEAGVIAGGAALAAWLLRDA